MSQLLKKCIFIILVLFSIEFVFAQKKKSYAPQFKFIEIKGHYGSHFYTGDGLKDALSEGYSAIEARLSWQSSNPEGWQSMFLYPSYGIGWYSGFIGDSKQLGHPHAIYGFISFPLLRKKRHEFFLEPALGLSYGLKPYDAEKNPNNDAVGWRYNAYINFALGARYRLSRAIDLVYGFDFTHLSNGRIFKPNKGLNMYGPNIGIRYHFNSKQNETDYLYIPTLLDDRPVFEIFRKPQPLKEFNLLAYISGGLVQNDRDRGTSHHYFTFTGLCEGQYFFNEKHGMTAGIDFFYDRSLRPIYPKADLDFFGVHLGYDYKFWRIVVRPQIGWYPEKEARKIKGLFFFRPALMFNINRILYAQIGLKTIAKFKADWLEWGIGVRLWTNKR